MEIENFTEFKKRFYSRVSDFSIFDCSEFNLLKIVLDGLRTNYSGKGRIIPYLFFPLFVYNFFLKLKRKNRFSINSISNKLSSFRGKKNLIVDIVRIQKDENGNYVSLYFYHFYKKLNNYVSISDTPFRSDFYYYDFTLREVLDIFYYEELDETDIKLRDELLKSFSTIKKSDLFNGKELKNIQIAIHLFFNEYRACNRILKIISPQQCFFLCHYQKEGMILAMKRNKVKTIELQHGLIAPEDIFYMFPNVIKPIRERALFANEIWVYGKFWKERLLKGAEYTDQQIKLFGYYLLADKQTPALVNDKLKKLKHNKKVILITTQTNLHR